jgi:diaminopimelate epimerase
MLKFSKLHATGNDFILLETLAQSQSIGRIQLTDDKWSELAQIMCDRHFGIGADGLILIGDSSTAELKMRLFNPDGSEAEVSGNGLRCVAKYAIERELIRGLPSQVGQSSLRLAIETLAGVRKVEAYAVGNEVRRVQVDMGVPRFEPDQIPVKVKVDIIPILDYPLVINANHLSLSLLSMGNPHAVNFSSSAVTDFPLGDIGPKVETHPMFPERTNFAVARVLGNRNIEAKVWERGVGETLACGSAACAIAVAAQLLKHVAQQVDITLPGGVLTVSWDRVGEVQLTGPVQEVFSGEWLGEEI